MADGRRKKFIKELLTKAKTRREQGLYVVDGPKMCAELSRDDVESVYVTEEFFASNQAHMCEKLLSECGYETVSASDMKQMSDTVTPQGILVVARQRRVKGLSGFLSLIQNKKAPLLLLLDTIQDPGNLGTILRASEAAGVDGIIMNRNCVDIYSPKVVRSTMGAVLRVPFLIVEDLLTAVERLKDSKYLNKLSIGDISFYAACLESDGYYTDFDYKRGSCFMIGNEAHGLSEELINAADRRIKIPMHGSVESLNAAMAATVLVFEADRQRRVKNGD